MKKFHLGFMLDRPSTLTTLLDVIWFYFCLAFKVSADYFQALKISFKKFCITD